MEPTQEQLRWVQWQQDATFDYFATLQATTRRWGISITKANHWIRRADEARGCAPAIWNSQENYRYQR
jgi:hypothetical protein